MLIILLLKGVLLGIAVAAPIGPIGTLCINRTMERGFWHGVSAGLGAAIGDMVFAIAAAAGFAAMQDLLAEISLPLKLIGGTLILLIGIRMLAARPPRPAAQIKASDFIRTTMSTFGLTITNPATIFGFAALFAGAGLADTGEVSPFFLVAGVFLGSLIWWFALCGAVVWLKSRLPDHFTIWVQRGSAVLLIGFGLISLGLAARQYWGG
ncbi:LysE family transporter [Agrobacterium vitis]|uniref:LysE family transporter n=1 Tax=Agrobacterium vitis TaxID=373 RepID=A0AAE2UXF9_AGRVI|nr:LysE family transporter [Agrobacterium vitis]MBF2716044.1 LysE family transporter [Agrobacterium vitis]MUZ65614.1 LysE family translocator [Agrobacterium vitis]MVA20875.1 LysE family translocator [Agrobacterium vitis]